MKFLIVFVALFAFALAAPPHYAPQHQQVETVRYDNEQNENGYTYSFENTDGTAASEQGQLKNVGGEEPAIVARGFFTFVAPDGQTFRVDYVADENGFHPVGAHLPVAA